jgi:hypothetical protein
VSYGSVTHDKATRIELKNIPVYDLVSVSGLADKFTFTKSGLEVKNYLVKLEYHLADYTNGAVSYELTYVQDSLNWNATGPNMTALGLYFSK